MRRLVLFIAVVVVLGGVGFFMVAGDRPDTVRTVFTVEGMHCEGCSTAITDSLEKTAGVIEASADWEAGRAEALYHARKVDAATLQSEIEGLGYTVTGTKTESLES